MYALQRWQEQFFIGDIRIFGKKDLLILDFRG